MPRSEIIDRLLYGLKYQGEEFDFELLSAPPILSLLTQYDIKLLNNIAKDPRLTGKIDAKYGYIKDILVAKGFSKFHAGTNRVIYKHSEYPEIVLKIAIDKVGLGDNPAEFKNQHMIKPFVPKTFEISSCGTIALSERVVPILSAAEFIGIIDDIYDIINDKMIGKYIFEDIGTKYFMNWGYRVFSRQYWGPVFLDYPYCYKLDGDKLYCNISDPSKGIVCDGEIDYDAGFNKLICTKCGAEYFAKDLSEKIKSKTIFVGRSNSSSMRVEVVRGNEIIKKSDRIISADTYDVDVIKRLKKGSKRDESSNNKR